MIKHIPSKETRRWGDALWKTYNVDLNRNPRHASLSLRMNLIEDSTDLHGASPYIAFLRSNADCEDRYWGLCDTGLIKTDSSSISSSPALDWDQDAIANTPTNNLDFTIHGNDSRNDSGRNKMFVTRKNGDIAVLNDTGDNTWNTGWWKTKQGQPSLDTLAFKHPIEYFPLTKITLIGDGNLIHTISRPSDTQNDTVTYGRLRLPNYYMAWHIFTTPSRAWVCCYNRLRKGGVIVEWDGFSQNYNAIHNTFGAVPISGVDYNGYPIVLNGKGSILEYTGNGFNPMFRNGRRVAFPVFEEVNTVSLVAGETDSETCIAPRGMGVGEDELIYFNMKQPPNPSFRQGAGVWCLDPNSGQLNNKYSLGVSTSGDTDNDSVYGQQFIYEPGGLHTVPAVIDDRGLLVSATLYANGGPGGGTITGTGLWLTEDPNSRTDPENNRGYFVTQPIPADEVKEFWDTLWLSFLRSLDVNSTIVVKARGIRPLYNVQFEPIELNAAWTSTTSFTATLSSGDESIQKGDEVEVISGVNSGWTAHVEAVSGSHGGLQTFTIDEAVDQGTSTSGIRFDRWKKLKTINISTKYEEMSNIGIDSSFIQFKVELRGPAKDMAVSDMAIVSKPSLVIQS